MRHEENLVYSTDSGKIDKKPKANQKMGESFKDGFLRIKRETKGRKGKGATCVYGLECDAATFKSLTATLKKKCGVGGSVKDGVIEIQGDKRETVKAELEKLGYKVKLSGG